MKQHINKRSKTVFLKNPKNKRQNKFKNKWFGWHIWNDNGKEKLLLEVSTWLNIKLSPFIKNYRFEDSDSVIQSIIPHNEKSLQLTIWMNENSPRIFLSYPIGSTIKLFQAFIPEGVLFNFFSNNENPFKDDLQKNIIELADKILSIKRKDSKRILDELIKRLDTPDRLSIKKYVNRTDRDPFIIQCLHFYSAKYLEQNIQDKEQQDLMNKTEDQPTHNKNQTSNLNKEIFTRKEFLHKSAALFGGLALSQIPFTKSLGATIGDLELFIPDIEGQTFGGRLDVHDDLGNYLGYTNFANSDPKITVTGIKDDNQITLETKVEKAFVGRPALQYTLDSAQNVRVAVHNILGQEIKTMNYGMEFAGTHLIELSDLPRADKRYLVTIQTDKFVASGIVIMDPDGSNFSVGTDSFKVPKKTSIIQAPSNSQNSFSVTSNNQTQLQGGRMLKASANATNYVFTITNPDAHYMRVFTAPIFGQTKFENRVVGYLPNALIEPERFRKFMEHCYFTSNFNGYNGNLGGTFNNVLVRWADSNNNGLPEKIVIYKNAFYNNQTSTFEQVTMDRLINKFNEKIKPHVGNVPFEIRELIDKFPYSDNLELNVITCMANSITEDYGSASVYGKSPATLTGGITRYRSGGPSPKYNDLGEPYGTTVVLQELLTCLFGPRSPPLDESIMKVNETVIHDTTNLADLTVFDKRSLKILTDSYFKTGENGSKIMGKY